MESPAPRGLWNEVLSSDPDAMPSQTPEWMDAMTAGSPWRDASRLYITESGRRIVFPLVRLGTTGTFAGVWSLRRGWGYGGVVADGGVSPDDIARVGCDFARIPELRLHVRPNPLHTEMWERFAPQVPRRHKVSHVVDLRGGPGAVRDRFHRSALQGVKKAEKRGVHVESVTGTALLPVFFDLARKSRRHWAQRQHEPLWLAQARGRLRDSEAKWGRIARALGSSFEVSVAWHEGRPVAAALVAQRPNPHGMRLAFDPELRQLCAPHLLNWHLLQRASDAGAHWFYLGESATEGAAAFKDFLGARRCQYAEIDYERIPLSRLNSTVRELGKRAIGFRG
jgi:hypothetical protein